MGKDDSRFLDTIARDLRNVPVDGSPGLVFDALARGAPIVGGLIGAIGGGAPASTVTSVVRLPQAVFEGWASTPPPLLQRMLAPLLPAAPGQIVSDTKAITGRFREEVDLLRQLRAAGLGEAAGYKIATTPTVRGGTAHRFMTFALAEGQTFSAEHRTLFARLQPAIHGALERLRVPLVASQPIFAQILEERTIGFLCLSRRRRQIVELNQRAYALILRYLRVAHVEAGRGALERFAERILVETVGQRTWQVTLDDGASNIQISTHWLAKEAHSLSEDLLLVMMEETTARPSRGSLERAGLTRRQMEIARLLCSSGLPYKQIAHRLDISEGTMRKHTEDIYRRLDVHSRAELVSQFSLKAW